MKPLLTWRPTRSVDGIPDNEQRPPARQPDSELTTPDFRRRRRTGLRNPASCPPEAPVVPGCPLTQSRSASERTAIRSIERSVQNSACPEPLSRHFAGKRYRLCATRRCAYRGQTIAQLSPSVHMTEIT